MIFQNGFQRKLGKLIASASSRNIEMRRTAIEEIYTLARDSGEKVSRAIPVLVDGLLDPDPKLGESSLWALKYCQPSSIPSLIECLASALPYVRERAAHSLGNIGPPAHIAQPSLRELLTDKEEDVRGRAAWALGLIHGSDPRTIAALVYMVTGGTKKDRGAALHALGNLGKASDDPDFLAPHRGLIFSTLDDPDHQVRQHALYAAESIGLDAQEEADITVSVLRRANADDAWSTLYRLENLAPRVDLRGALPDLIALLEQPGSASMGACKVIGSMVPAPREALGPLRALLGRGELDVAVAKALWRIEGQIEPLLEPLKRGFEYNGEAICDLICEMGPVAAPLLPELIKALADEDYWDLQWAVADALAAVASPDVSVMDALRDALSHPSPLVRAASSRALAKTGTAAVDGLRAIVADRSDRRGVWAAWTLGEIGISAAMALPELRGALGGPDRLLASYCAVAVAQIAGDVAVLPQLIAVLRSDFPDEPRCAAALALAGMGPAAKPAVATLKLLLDDEDVNVQKAVQNALSEIQGAAH